MNSCNKISNSLTPWPVEVYRSSNPSFQAGVNHLNMWNHRIPPVDSVNPLFPKKLLILLLDCRGHTDPQKKDG